MLAASNNRKKPRKFDKLSPMVIGHALWERLRLEGWYSVNADTYADAYGDWIYVCKETNVKDGKDGLDYFHDLSQVISFINGTDPQMIEEVLDSLEETKREAAKTAAANPRKRKNDVAQRQQANKNKSPPTWYRTTPIPSFTRNIWPILQKLGVKYQSSSGYYKLPLRGGDCARAADLRLLLVQHGIPNIKRASDEEYIILDRWVSFTNVPIKEGSIVPVDGKKIREMTNDDASNVLTSKLGFCIEADGSYRRDEQKFESLEQVRVYFRGAESLDWPSRGQRDSYLSPKTVLRFRLWAALAENPLPTFSSSSKR